MTTHVMTPTSVNCMKANVQEWRKGGEKWLYIRECVCILLFWFHCLCVSFAAAICTSLMYCDMT